MAYSKDKAIELAKYFLTEASNKHPISFAYLFGSYVRGNQNDYSDIDIAVVLGRDIEGDKYYKESEEIFHEAQEYNSLLETVCFREDEFDANGGSIVSKIKREGLRIEF